MGCMFFEDYADFAKFVLCSDVKVVARYLANQYKISQSDAVITGKLSPVELKKRKDRFYDDLLESGSVRDMFQYAVNSQPTADDAIYWHHFLAITPAS